MLLFAAISIFLIVIVALSGLICAQVHPDDLQRMGVQQ
mgnify:CR=1 FL=1